MERRDPEGNYHKMTVEELSKVAPDFEWRTYFTVLGAPEPGGMDVGQPEFIAAAVRLFPGYAQVWRVDVRMESMRQSIKLDPHSPWQFRCNGPLSNLPEFQKAFGVPGGAPGASGGDADPDLVAREDRQNERPRPSRG